MHEHCFRNFRLTKQKCPQCDADWASPENAARLVDIGERAAREGDDNKRRAKRRATTEESDQPEQTPNGMDDDEEDVDEEQPTQTQRNGRRSSSRRGYVSLPSRPDVLFLDEDT